MRKLLLAASVLLVSVTAYAGPSVQVAANDTPQATPTENAAAPATTAAPAQPAAEPAKAAESKSADVAKPKRQTKRHESAEHKARRIAAKYGISW